VSRPPTEPPAPPSGRIETTPYGTLEGGRSVELYRLTASSGMSAEITNYGGIVRSLHVPDGRGRLADVVLGYDRLEEYVADRFFFGALIGRYANRIAGGAFSLGDLRIVVEKNQPPNHLHGGSEGFHKVLWNARAVDAPGGIGLELSHRSPDGHGGYPGNLDVTVVYTLTDDALAIEYAATSDRDTVVNLTHHSYFNLSGDPSRSVLDHEVSIRARRFTPVDRSQIPTGELRDVAGTPFDFTQQTPIGARIDADDEQLGIGGGYDHNWVFDHDGPEGAQATVARVVCPASGRVLEVATTEPGIQFYSGNSIAAGLVGKGGARYGRRSAICLETQHFPDSPNQPGFPSVTLRAGQAYRSTTTYRFGAV
jgi:aldose 1-epimerase